MSASRLRRHWAAVGGLVLGVGLLGIPVPASADTMSASALLTRLAVATPTPTGYDRSLFGAGWIDANGDGCDTRQEVLKAESQVPVTISSGCDITAGQWYSPYDGQTWTDPADVDIDHMVPLGEAWASGANQWTSSQRLAYANDLDFADALRAVTDNVNQSKGDQDPAQWLPPLSSDDCQYAVDWVAIKWRWSLTVDSAEKSTLSSLLSGSCGATTVTVTRMIAPPAQAANRLTGGQTLTAGQALVSANGAYRLVMQTDGNAVVYTAGRAVWNSRTNGNPGARLALQSGDGNLVVYSASNRPLWFNGARGSNVRLVMQSDGNLVEYSGSTPLWDIRHGKFAPPSPTAPGLKLTAGQQTKSANGSYRLVMQTDGNLVEYAAGNRVVWYSHTNGHGGAYLIMQSDGNAVIYAAGRALWNTRTGGNRDARMVLQTDGNIVVYSTANRPLWASGVDHPPAPGGGDGSNPPPNPGDTKNCGDFTTWQAAQNWFNTYYPYYGDVAHLDSDGDLIACETLPGAP